MEPVSGILLGFVPHAIPDTVRDAIAEHIPTQAQAKAHDAEAFQELWDALLAGLQVWSAEQQRAAHAARSPTMPDPEWQPSGPAEAVEDSAGEAQ